MSNLASHFKAYSEGGLTPSVEAWTEDDAHALQSLMDDCVAHQERLEACTTMESLISEASGMSRYLATQLETYGIEGFDFDTYPESSFTELPSNVNHSVTMESLDNYKKLLIGGGIAGLLLLLAKFIKWLTGRGNDSSNTPEGSTSAHSAISKSTEKTLKDIENRIKDMERTGRKTEREIARAHAVPSGQRVSPLPPLEIVDPSYVEDDNNRIGVPRNTGDDKPTPENIRDKILAEWRNMVDHAIERSIKMTLEKEETNFHLPFLMSVIENDLYSAMADVIGEMNSNLEEIDKGFTEALALYKDAMTDPTSVVRTSNVFLKKNMLGPVFKDDNDNDAAVYRRGANFDSMSGFTKAESLIREYDAMLAAHNQPDYLPLARYSNSFKMYNDGANPSTVVSEVFSSIRSIQDTRIRYKGESLVMPDRFLKRLQTWLEEQTKASNVREDMKGNTTYIIFFNNVQRAITRITAAYSGLTKIIARHNVEIRRSKKFVDVMIGNYNAHVKDYTAKVFFENGYEKSSLSKEYDEAVKALSLPT